MATEVVVGATKCFAYLGVLLLAACNQTGGLAIEPAPEWEPADSSSGDAGSDGGDDSGIGDPPLPGTSTSGGTTGGGPAGPLLIPAQSVWQVSLMPPAGDWQLPEYDASSWQEAVAPFGNGSPDLQTTLEPGAAAVYARYVFAVETPASYAGLLAHVRRADGIVLHLNGTEVARSNTLGEAAEVQAQGNEARRYLRFGVAANALVAGENVLTATIYRSSTANPYVFDLQLEDVGTPQKMYVQLRTRSYNGEYASRNVSAIWVERPSGEFVRSLGVWANVRREHLVKWRSASLDNTVDAVTGATRGGHGTLTLEWDLGDANGQPVAPGDYHLLAEFTEDDSNKGAPAGPAVQIPVTVGQGQVFSIEQSGGFRDITVVAP